MPLQAASLAGRGISLAVYAGVNLGVQILFSLVYGLRGVYIFWRRPQEPMAWLASLTLITLAGSFPSALSVPPEANPTWRLPATLITAVGLVSFWLFLSLSPNGRFVPSWIPWLLGAGIIPPLLTTLFPGTALDPHRVSQLFADASLFGLLLARSR